MLADAKDIESELIGELDLLEQIANALCRRYSVAGPRVGCRFGEGVDAYLPGVDA
jgi:hypothetical protein